MPELRGTGKTEKHIVVPQVRDGKVRPNIPEIKSRHSVIKEK